MSCELLIRNGNVWDGVKFSKQDILIQNGIIIKIQQNIEEKAEKEFQAEGMIVSSGFIDFHTHVKHFSPDSIGIDAKKISFPFGVTHLVDASTHFVTQDDNIFGLAEVRIADNKADFSAVEPLLTAHPDKVIGLKVFFDKTFGAVYNTDPLKEVCKYAKKRNLSVMVHTTNSPVKMYDIVSVLNKGDILSHAFHGGEHNAAEDSFLCLRYAKEKGVYIDAALAAYYHIDYSICRQAIACGIYPDIISSDITKDLEFVSDTKYGLTICMSILENLGLDRETIMKAVTVRPGSLLSHKQHKGLLCVGDVTDIAVFKTNYADFTITDRYDNQVTLNQYLQCVLTIHNGEIVYYEQ